MTSTTENENGSSAASIEALEAELAGAIAKRDALRGELEEKRRFIAHARDTIGAETWKIDLQRMTIGYGMEDCRYVLREHMHPEDADAFLKQTSRLRRDHPRFGFEPRLPDSQGAWRRFWFCGRVETFDVDGRPALLVGVKTNISDKIQSVEREPASSGSELRLGSSFVSGNVPTLSEEQLRELLDASFVVFYEHDISGKGYLYVSPAIEGYFPQAKDHSFEQVMKEGHDTLHPDDSRETMAAIHQLFSTKTGQPVSKALTYRRRNVHGQYRWFYDTMTLLPDCQGKFQSMFGSAIDITTQKEAESALRVAEEQYRMMIKLSSAVIWSCGLDLQYDYCSPSVVDLLGYTPEEIIGLRLEKTLCPESAAEVAVLIREALEKEENEPGAVFHACFESWQRHKNGGRVLTEIAASVRRDDSGRLIGFCGATRNITHFHLLKETLKTSRDELEKNVLERTNELTRANENLCQEIERRRQVETALLEMIESEQRSIGHELHDGLCQQLAGIMCLCQSTREHLMEKGSIDAIQMGRIHDLLGAAVRYARYMARSLSPLFIDSEGLCNSLETLAVSSTAMFKVKCHFQKSGTCLVQNPEQALSLYRIAREAVHRAIQVGKADRIDILLETSSLRVFLIVSDNGCDRTAAAFPAPDYGLRMIEYRMRAMEGNVRIRTLRGGGTVLRCSAPFTCRQKGDSHVAID